MLTSIFKNINSIEYFGWPNPHHRWFVILRWKARKSFNAFKCELIHIEIYAHFLTDMNYTQGKTHRTRNIYIKMKKKNVLLTKQSTMRIFFIQVVISWSEIAVLNYCQFPFFVHFRTSFWLLNFFFSFNISNSRIFFLF